MLEVADCVDLDRKDYGRDLEYGWGEEVVGGLLRAVKLPIQAQEWEANSRWGQ